jgi:hypothetical protein
VVCSPGRAEGGRREFLVATPDSPGRLETVVFREAAKEDKEGEREGSPCLSDSGSITVKEELIGGEAREERRARKQRKGRVEKKRSVVEEASKEVASTVVEPGASPRPDSAGGRRVDSTGAVEEQAGRGAVEEGETGEGAVEGRGGAVEVKGGEEYRFFCKLCHIGFLKETSYKYHFANNVELHKKMKTTTGQKRKCDECGKSFGSDKLFRRHMYLDHKLDDPFFCKICNIVLKNESAYKSHHR